MVQTVALARDPVGVLKRCRARYGAIFTLRLLNAGPTVVLADRDAAEALLERDPELAHAGAARRAILPQASRRSSFGADGDLHRKLRSRVETPLSAERMAEHQAVVRAIAENHVQRLPRGRPVRLLARMRALTEEVFVRVGLGVESAERARELARAVGRVLRVPGNPPLPPPGRDRLLGRMVDRELERRLKPVTELLERELAWRRNEGGAGEGGSILDLLASDECVDGSAAADELLVVMAAAQEPMSIGLTWTALEIGTDSDAVDRYLDGAAEVRAAMVDEVLRIRPPAMASLRELEEDREILGHALPEGTAITISIPLIHLDVATFPAPTELWWDRFAGTRRRPSAFMPFGAGPRSCPGRDLAHLELATVLPILLERFRVKRIGRPERPVQRATVLVPDRSGLAVLSPRD